MVYLSLSIAVLLIGPIAHYFSKENDKLMRFIDAACSTVIVVLIFIEILPELYIQAGWIIIVPVLLGLLLPGFIEKRFRKLREGAHKTTFVLAVLGLVVHTMIDGVALEEEIYGESHHISALLPLSILLHRLPVSLIVWWLLRPRYSLLVSWAVLLTMAIGTVLGFTLGQQFTTVFSGLSSILFQGLVLGALLHVIFHRIEHKSPHNDRYSGLGAALGLVVIALLFIEHHNLNSPVMNSIYGLLIESAPALLLGYLLAGLVNVMMKDKHISWLKRGGPGRQAVKGMAVGLPIPVCSCGVVPIYDGLVRKGVPMSAGVAFLIATPELGIDALILSLPLLGAEMTAIRVVGAAILALTVGWLMGVFKNKNHHQDQARHEHKEKLSIRQKVRKAFYFGFVEVVDHTAPWLLLGIIAAAMVQTFVDFTFIGTLPMALAVAAFAVAGIPVYVCASGATPLVAIFLLKGVSPGAALAFLLTGPATNVTTFGVLSGLHGKKLTFIFSLLIICISIGLGIAVDMVFAGYNFSFQAMTTKEEINGWQMAAVGLLTLIFAYSFIRRGPRDFLREIVIPFGSHSHSHAHSHGHNHDHSH